MSSNNGTGGGLLHGPTDKNGGKGIVASAPGQPVILGGGEVIVNENAVNSSNKKSFNGKQLTNCEILSEINQETGGVPIPCNSRATANTSGKMEKGGEVPDDFDWDALYNAPDPDPTPVNTVEQEREEMYQKSRFDKKWAATYSEAKKKLLAEHAKAVEEYEDWAARRYKENRDTVFVGPGELEGAEYSKKYINESRRKKRMAGFKMTIEETREDLKSLGLTEEEITTELSKMEDGGIVTSSQVSQPWHMTLSEYLSAYPDKDKDYYKFHVIGPLLHESAERNVFLLAVETGQLPYEKAMEIIESAGFWGEGNKFVRQLLEYEHVRHYSANIWLMPKSDYLAQPYYQKRFPSLSKREKWYAAHLYHLGILDDTNLIRLLNMGLVTREHIKARFRDANFRLNTNEQEQVQRHSARASFRLKLKTFISMLVTRQAATDGRGNLVEVATPLASNGNFPNLHAEFVKKLITDTNAGVTYNKPRLEKLAQEFGIKDQNTAKELAELSISMMAREIGFRQGLDPEHAYKQLVTLYEKQVNLSHRTSESILMQQYSTPAPIGFLMGLYCGVDKQGAYFEPSAGNGLLTTAGSEQWFTVNELDPQRSKNLAYQEFHTQLKQDATEPFQGYAKKFDAILTNPPFGTVDTAVDYDGYKITSLEQLMALRALDTMKDNGKAAIIIGGHMEYDKEGRIKAGKNRIFFSYLFSHYNVEDTINIDGHKLYSRQGTGFNVRLILINGRKQTPGGYPPLVEGKQDVMKSYSPTPVQDYPTLYMRVSLHNLGMRVAQYRDTLEEQLPTFKIMSNQYMPGGVVKDYYYIESRAGFIWHHADKKWRKTPLKQMKTYYFKYKEEAEAELSRLQSGNG